MTFLKTFIASIFALIVATSCSDESFDGNVEYNERIDFSVSPLDWRTVSNNAAEGNAVHTKCNIPNSNYSIETIVEQTPDVEVAPKTRATEINTSSLQEQGFNVTAVVTDKNGTNPSLLMKDQDVSYSSSWTYSPVKYWPNNKQYTTIFYAYRKDDFTNTQNTESDGCTPILSYTVSTDPTEQKDLIAAKYTNNDYGTVNFQLKHLLTAIKIKTKNIKRPILRIELTGIKNSGEYHLNDMQWTINAQTGDFKYSFVGSQLIGSTSVNGEAYVMDGSSDIYLMMLPQNLAENSNARIKILFDNGTVLQAPLNTNWEEGKTVTYVVSYNDVTCQWLEDSNSYIISPINDNNNNANLFAIPISYRINTFWQNEGGGVKPITGGTQYVAEVIWQDDPNQVISFTDSNGNTPAGTYSATVPENGGDNEYIYFKLATPDFTTTSNVVVGVRRQNEDTYLWSWHLWITPYYPIPSSPQSLSSAARIQVQNGWIERYDDSDVEGAASNWDKLPNRYLMDRNIGAKGSCNVEITEQNYKNTFGMYYQFGRKDPFPPNGKLYKMKDDSSIESLGELTSGNASLIVPTTNKNIPFDGTEPWPVVKTVQYPMEFVVANVGNQHMGTSGNWRNPDWYAAGSTPGSKSFYDPCPPGWRIPYGTIFNVFGKKYNSNKSFQVEDEDKLKIGEQVIGNKYYIDKNQSLSTNYYIWFHRYPVAGTLWDNISDPNNEGNSLIWRSESFRIFQLFIHYSGSGTPQYGWTDIDNTCDMECYGAQVRAIHE